MQSIHYRLGKPLNANKIMHDIDKMIKNHTSVNKVQDAILTIQIKDISYTYDQEKLKLEKDGG